MKRKHKRSIAEAYAKVLTAHDMASRGNRRDIKRLLNDALGILGKYADRETIDKLVYGISHQEQGRRD